MCISLKMGILKHYRDSKSVYILTINELFF